MRQRASVLLAPKMCGNATGNDGAAWIAGKECLPTLSLSMNPKMPLAWLYVTAFSIFTTVGYMLPMYSRLEKIKVLFTSNPQAIMSRAFSLPA